MLDIGSDLEIILNEIGHSLILREVTKTLDSMGRTTLKSIQDTAITGYIHNVTHTDVELLKQGWTIGKEAVGILASISVEPHSLIVDGSIVYEVLDIISRPNIAGIEYCTRCRLRKVQ